jgi:predicted metal-dependent hydrolase
VSTSSGRQAVVRLLPQQPFPPYTFVPGQSPHPLSDPGGHSFGSRPALPAVLDPEHWQACESYLYGLDLFNGGYYWESHETLEGLWHAAGRHGSLADFLKGLIKLAAAGVKHLEGKPAGVQSHSCRAAQLLREATQTLDAEKDLFLGLRLDRLIQLAEAVCQSGWPDAPPWILPVLADTARRLEP